MDISIQKSSIVNRQSSIQITGSKSEANRLLILQALYPQLQIKNLSNSDDSQLMQRALASIENTVDIHHAGTAMRFLTAYFSSKEGREVVLTGSKRMKERPIGILVDALTTLGADISYLENEGFPPLKIKGRKITKSKVSLKASVSSQYISALLLIAPTLENGLELTLDGKITSVPYIKMTLSLLDQIGVENSFKANVINVSPTKEVKPNTLVVESDWSSASYFYSIVALSNVGTQVTLSSYKKDSLQGDSILAEIYTKFGVETEFKNNSIVIKKTSSVNSDSLTNLDLSNAPDIAQTIAVSSFGLGLQCQLTGLHTLKIKETDRLEALKAELTKLGAKIEVTNDTLTLYRATSIIDDVQIETYNDHRMAMAFAPLALKTSITIKDADVVSKSYPDFWNDLKKVGFQIN
ncbi:3-phosphoshikimate 1-carboxyvinyltransferase [Winogradskyella jejuensis]|uniref:3-phosphoshikimate 1-carboxyvinyltransferase n=1 Tax=Winogradskyella jejuensis TaxID=1089305 RepID=A0A1M5PHM3_9FLAO|nr:3-phosphoshikimate 1-carboxyvinyltransferase [Winogradskyella jejuensis]SHH01237.1 3-phosphoshikimate 1-carboxyvinyltransferase [Winogradskyella jejuensis]